MIRISIRSAVGRFGIVFLIVWETANAARFLWDLSRADVDWQDILFSNMTTMIVAPLAIFIIWKLALWIYDNLQFG
jgi:hypothetical protein